MSLFEFKPKVLDFYNTLINDKNDLFSDEQKLFLKNSHNELENEKFSIVVAGRFSAGKSTLINRTFLKVDILPSKNEPTTCHPVHIVYGEKNQLFLCDDEGNQDVVAEDDEAIKEALEKYGAQYSKDSCDKYQHFQLSWNDPDVLQKGVILVDTIGTEDTEERYIQKTFYEMERGTAVLFLFNTQQAGTNSERMFLDKYLKETGKKLFIVLNKSDARSAKDREIILADFKNRVKPFFDECGIRVDDRIFMVSAKTNEGLDELRQHLIKFIANDRLKELLQQHTKQLEKHLNLLQAQLKTHLQDLQNKKNGDVQKLKETQKKIETIEQDLEFRKEEISDLKDNLVDKANRNLSNKIDSLNQRTNLVVRTADSSDQLQDVLTDMLNELIQLCESTSSTLQSNIRELLNQRIRGWSPTLAIEEIEARFTSKIDNWSLYNAGEILGGTSAVGGIAATIWGVGQVFATYTTAVTTAANAGLLSRAWSTLFGGSVAKSTPALAILGSAALPIAAGGLVIAIAGYGITKSMRDKKIKHNKDMVRKVITELLNKAKREIFMQIKVCVNEQIDSYLSRLKIEINQQKRELDAIINEKDIKVLQKQIDDDQLKVLEVSRYIQQLNMLTVILH